jgi:hypothetical protein
MHTEVFIYKNNSMGHSEQSRDLLKLSKETWNVHQTLRKIVGFDA